MHDRIKRLTPLVWVAGELQPGDFAALSAQGFRAVVSTRPDGEDAGQLTARQEASLAWRSGLGFRHVPAAKHELFTDGPIEALAAALDDFDGPVVIHCKSGIRAAILWAAASARSQPVDCVLAALERAGFDLDFLRDELEAQADRKRWLGQPKALDCAAGENAREDQVAAA